MPTIPTVRHLFGGVRLKRLVRTILLILQVVFTLLCATTIYDILKWTKEYNSDSPKALQTIPPRTTYARKSDNSAEDPASFTKITPQRSTGISASNHAGTGLSGEANPHNSNIFLTKSNKYPVNVTGSKNSASGFVIVDESGTVYTGLNEMVSAMGWTLLKDGSVFSDEQPNNKIMKFQLNNLPNYTIMFRGRSVTLKHPVVSTDGSVFIPLSDLKDLWILNFSIDPVSKNLNLSYSLQ